MKLVRNVSFCFLVLVCGLTNAATTASFDATTNILTLPTVKVDGAATFNNVVVRILDYGTLVLDDPSVATGEIIYTSQTNALHMPMVTVGSESYPRISLTNPAFTLVSIDGVAVDAGTSGNYNLDIVVAVSGVSVPIPPIRIENVDKPSAQTDFCHADIYNQAQQSILQGIQQSIPGASATWSITSCSFDGTSGQIAMQLSITSPYAVSFTYSATYTYTPR